MTYWSRENSRIFSRKTELNESVTLRSEKKETCSKVKHLILLHKCVEIFIHILQLQEILCFEEFWVVLQNGLRNLLHNCKVTLSLFYSTFILWFVNPCLFNFWSAGICIIYTHIIYVYYMYMCKYMYFRGWKVQRLNIYYCC